MNWQVFLTVWLLIQMVASTASQPKVSRLKGHNDGQLVSSIAGNIMKFIGIFTCLYFGGFYS